MAVKSRAPKAVRRAAQTGVPAQTNVSLSVETLQLSHEALVQMRKPNSQVTLAVARAMNELEGLIQVFGAQQQQAQAPAPAEGDAAPAPAAASEAAPKVAKRRKR